MEVTDPTTGLPVTVRMRRDLPGYSVTRARRSPRLRWSLPVDIQWETECIMKFLGQSCACCDGLLAPGRGKDDLATPSSTPTTTQKTKGPGHDTVFVESQTKVSKSSSGGGGNLEKQGGTKTISEQTRSQTSQGQTITTTTTSVTSEGSDVTVDDVTQRLSPLALDNFPGFPLPPSNGSRRVRKRRQLVSTSDMLLPQGPAPEAEVTRRLTPFDVMQSHLAAPAETKDTDVTQYIDSDVTQTEVTARAPLADISEDLEEGAEMGQVVS